MVTKVLPWGTNFCPERTTYFPEQESEEVSAFASRLDNQIRQAKNHGAKLLPDKEDCHLRLLFWQGLKESVKDKA